MMKCQQRITWICIPVSKGEVVVVAAAAVVGTSIYIYIYVMNPVSKWEILKLHILFVH